MLGGRRRLANTVQVNAVGDEAFSQAWLWPHVRAYNEAIAKVVGKSAPSSPYFLHGSWVSGTPLGDLLNVKLFEVIIAYEESLIEELHRNAVDGSIVEFGVFQGHMLGRLLDTADRIGMRRATSSDLTVSKVFPSHLRKMTTRAGRRVSIRQV